MAKKTSIIGEIVSYSRIHGYGFIKASGKNSADYFFHFSNVDNGVYPVVGMKVEITELRLDRDSRIYASRLRVLHG